MITATTAWRERLWSILQHGKDISPRGMRTKELLGEHDVINMQYPVVQNVTRKLSYHFMAAEAFWILSGDNRLSELERYAPQMRRYSDDGLTLTGAYGPHIKAQLEYVVNILRTDPDTRQAALTIWQPNPGPSADIPCTVSMIFQLRRHQTFKDTYLLHNHVTMRSSDAWLGFPYDVFSFSMVAYLICNMLNERWSAGSVEPGSLFLTMASSHLYESTWEQAYMCLQEPIGKAGLRVAPASLWWHGGSDALLTYLAAMRDDASLRWWEGDIHG